MHRIITLIAATALAFVASAALAQNIPCGERDTVLEWHAKQYQETPIGAGVTSAGGLIEVLTDTKGGTWTIIVTTPEGMSCLVAAGEGWRDLVPRNLDPEA